MENFSNDISKSIEVLKKGGTILYPTDTIWGIGCDATNPNAVKKVYNIKEREKGKAMIVLFDTIGHIEKYVKRIPLKIKQMILQSTPVTVIFSNAEGLTNNLLADDNSIAIRKTNEIFSKTLITEFGKPIVSTSANKSGNKYPKNFSEISADIIDAADYVVEYRQKEYAKTLPSKIIKLLADDSIQQIR